MKSGTKSSRNPIAGNAWKYNKRQIINSKKIYSRKSIRKEYNYEDRNR